MIRKAIKRIKADAIHGNYAEKFTGRQKTTAMDGLYFSEDSIKLPSIAFTTVIEVSKSTARG